MSQLELTGRYFLGVPEIDNQHQTLLDMINQMHDIIMTKGSNDDFKVVIEAFIDYTRVHFKDEERFMKKNNYPLLKEHILIHRGFVDAVTKIIEKFSNSKFLRFKFFNLAMDLLMNHIELEDFKFAKFLKDERLNNK